LRFHWSRRRIASSPFLTDCVPFSDKWYLQPITLPIAKYATTRQTDASGPQFSRENAASPES
jgi:hypothetical protein